ncbi:M48 family metalloprotease [bacterium]|nr:M48 family metalloprotease [bacterium]
MSRFIRKYSFFIVLGVMLLSGALVLINRMDTGEANFSSLMEIIGDIQKGFNSPVNKITRMSDEEENFLGHEIFERTKFSNEEFSVSSAYVASLAEGLVQNVNRKGIKYKFHLLRSSQVNAFSLPGGQILVTTGMLNFLQSESELAAILGHEISHVDLRHCVEFFQLEASMDKLGNCIPVRGIGNVMVKIPANTAVFLNRLNTMGFNKFQEFDADLAGLKIVALSGYMPDSVIAAMTRFKERFEKSEPSSPSRNPIEEIGQGLKVAADSYFNSHPAMEERIEKVKTVLKRDNSKFAGKSWYKGKENLEKRVPRSTKEFPNEFSEMNPY